jgi:hypothetical protein
MTLLQKSVLATVLLVLALGQLTSISIARGWLGSHGGRALRRALVAHRIGGYTGLAIILFIAFNCLFIIHYVGNPYKYMHMTLGALAVAIVMAKVTIARGCRCLKQALPRFGAALLITIAGAWFTSALWYLVNFG